MRHLEFAETACKHLGITTSQLNQSTQQIPYKELMVAQEDGQLAATIDM